eukprot:Lankesteria_metandrocarpae@DN1271_c0_g1_i1.p1
MRMKFVKVVGCLAGLVGTALMPTSVSAAGGFLESQDTGGVQAESALGPEIPVKGFGGERAPLVTGGESYNPEQHKPKVADVFLPLMFRFFRPSPAAQLCSDVINGLSTNEGTTEAYISLTVVQGLLDGSAMETASDNVQADKNMEITLTQLATQMIREGASDGQGDLVHHMGDIIKCVSDEETGRTLLQSMVVKGMEKSLKTPFAAQLMRGSSEYDPAVASDKFGNTLLHLAVMSKGVNVPKTLIQIEQDKNKEDPSRRMNILYWISSCLDHTNDDGMKALALCESTTMADELKRMFRTFALFFKTQAKKHGLSTETANNTMDMLKTSGTLAQEEASVNAHIAQKVDSIHQSMPSMPMVSAAA